ncbi:MAG: hypothetical protein HQL54_07995 [Magnetococcales bacterium]|nr:hypothetical protein [Magnetococcales bacterium]
MSGKRDVREAFQQSEERNTSVNNRPGISETPPHTQSDRYTDQKLKWLLMCIYLSMVCKGNHQGNEVQRVAQALHTRRGSDPSQVITLFETAQDEFIKIPGGYFPAMAMLELVSRLMDSKHAIEDVCFLTDLLYEESTAPSELYTQFVLFVSRLCSMARQAQTYYPHIINIPTDTVRLLTSMDSGFNLQTNRAIRHYARGLNAKQVLAIYDAAYFKSAKKGFLITELGLILDQSELVFFNEIDTVSPYLGGIELMLARRSFRVKCLWGRNSILHYLGQITLLNR